MQSIAMGIERMKQSKGYEDADYTHTYIHTYMQTDRQTFACFSLILLH